MQAYSNIWLIPSNKTTWTLKDTLPKTDRIQDLDNKTPLPAMNKIIRQKINRKEWIAPSQT
jgi:hypothetical protein